MDARMFVEGVAVMMGFACLFAAVQAGSVAMRRRRVSMAAQGDSMSLLGLIGWRVRNGFGFALPLAGALLKAGPVAQVVDEVARFLERRNMASTRESACSVLLVVVVLAAIAVGIVAGNPIASFTTLVCLCAALYVVSGSARDKRREAVREAVPDALESMAACLGSGFTLLQTFEQVADDTHGPLAATFARSANVLEMGGTAERALAELREGAHASELAFVAVALDVQHQSGGAMRQVLDAATDSVKGELALRRSLRVQTAQAKLSARVVVMMPFVLVAAFSLASPDFLTPFFSSVPGYALLGLAIVMEVAGVVLVRRALNVEGVS